MSNLTQQIAGAYIGAQVEISGIGTYGISHISANGIMVDTGERFKYTPYDQCRLILTPLSAISDEDAVEVARMSLLSARYCWERWGSNSSILSVGREIANDLFEDFGDPVFVAPKYLSNIIDYLRSRNYDLGYMGIRSLIDAGIAISSLDKTDSNVQP